MMKRLLLTVAVLVACLGPGAIAQIPSQATYVGTTGGSANAYTATVPNISSTADLLGVPIRLLPHAANTTTSTIAFNGLTAMTIRKPTATGPAVLTGGELIASPAQAVEGMWDGTQFLLISNLNASPTATVPTPQGYLTPCSAASPPTGCTAGLITPTGDVTVGSGQAVTGVVYTPYNGNQVPIYNGSAFVVQTFAELTLTIPTSRLANTLYDVCVTTATAGVYSTSGTPTLVFSVAWTTSTAGAGARGTGAGTAQISKLNGIWVNTVTFSGVNGATTISNIPASTCTIIGTMLIGTSNGIITYTQTYGQSRVWPFVNIYNKQPILLQTGDSTASWTPGNAVGPVNASANNKATVLSAVPEDWVSAVYDQHGSVSYSSATSTLTTGIGLNSTTVASGKTGALSAGNTSTQGSGVGDEVSRYNLPPFIGINVLQMLESGAGTRTHTGTVVGCLMTVTWRGDLWWLAIGLVGVRRRRERMQSHCNDNVLDNVSTMSRAA